MNQLSLQFDAPEEPKAGGQKAKILDRLRKGPATSRELNEIAFRYSARIHELRDAGWKIETRQLENNFFEFELTE